MIKSRLLSDSMQKYRNNCYIAHKLDATYFDALIAHSSILYNDGMDALDNIPAGSMVNFGRWHAESLVSRNLTAREAAEIDVIAESIINEILNEEK